MNLTPMIAKALGVKIGEEFKISGYGKTKFVFRTCFQLADEDEEFEHSTDTVFTNLCLGVSELIQTAVKPLASAMGI